MEMEKIFAHVGGFGRCQIRFVTWLCLIRAIHVLNLFSYAFIKAPPTSVCALNEEDDANFTLCECPPAARVFDTRNASSIVSTFHLTCDRQWLIPLTFSLKVLGSLGQPVLGFAGDRFGRKPLIFGCVLGSIATHQTAGLVNDFITFATCCLINGFFSSGIVAGVSILGNELVAGRRRSYVSAAYSVGMSFGLVILSALAYAFRHWRAFYGSLSVAMAITLAFYFDLPESPRWLLSRKRTEEAKAVLERIAKGNGNAPPDWIEFEATGNGQVDESEHDVKHTKSITLCDMFSTWRLLAMSLTVTYGISAITILYYSTTLLAGPVSGDLYLGMALSGLMEIPADFAGAYLMTLFGRKRTVAVLLIVSGAFLAAQYFVAYPASLSIGAVFCAKFCASASFALSVVHISEMFPTRIRTTALTSVFLVRAAVSASAPYIVDLGANDEDAGLTFMALGASALLAGVGNLAFLPETSGKEMPETIRDVRNLFKKSGNTATNPE